MEHQGTLYDDEGIMENQYIEQRDQGYWIIGSRVSLDSVIIAFLNGLSPETIAAECFPTLTLEQVYGAITYYLAHREEIDAYLQQENEKMDALRRKIYQADPNFTAKLAQARRRMEATRS